jgi:hypothetical protein
VPDVRLSDADIDLLLTAIAIATSHVAEQILENPDTDLDFAPFDRVARKLERSLGRPVTPRTLDIIARYISGQSTTEIAKAHKMTGERVRQILVANDIPRRRRGAA